MLEKQEHLNKLKKHNAVQHLKFKTFPNKTNVQRQKESIKFTVFTRNLSQRTFKDICIGLWQIKN